MSRNWGKYLFAGAIIALLTVTVVYSVPVASKSSAERRNLRFSHQFHVEENGLTCDACHVNVEQSTTGLNDLLPTHQQCAVCHDVETASTCNMCHLSEHPTPSPRVAKYSPRFSHAKHVAQMKLECTTCHQNLDAMPPPEKAGHYPNMTECLNCHEQRNAATKCETCHEPDHPRQPANHLVNWLNGHGAAASEGERQQCNQCHGRENIVSCQGCHTGDQVFSPHPRNYVSRHGQDAHLSDLNCVVCHDRESDCNACHNQLNVIPAGHFRPGWVTPDGGEHREQAQFDLESCMSCHDSPKVEITCVRCHGK